MQYDFLIVFQLISFWYLKAIDLSFTSLLTAIYYCRVFFCSFRAFSFSYVEILHKINSVWNPSYLWPVATPLAHLNAASSTFIVLGEGAHYIEI